MDYWIRPFSSESPAKADNILLAALAQLAPRKAKELKTDSEPLKLVQNRFDPELNKSLSPYLNQFLSQTSNLDGVISLVSRLWEFNARLLEGLGYQAGDPEYLEEHNHIQNAMFEILNKPRSHQETEEKPRSHQEEEEDAIADLIFDSLKNDAFQKTYKPSYEPSIRVSMYQMKMTESVVQMLRYHYKKKNIVKWYNIFEDEAGYLLALEKIARRIRSRDTNWYLRHKGKNRGFEAIRATHLLPWENPMHVNSSQRTRIMNLFRRRGNQQ
ncbi:hypothetical protein PtB15_4B26 [Puccinia triticina]|nr:hypothetical protein PtB15_4B26 [Puccinia triticina]